MKHQDWFSNVLDFTRQDYYHAGTLDVDYILGTKANGYIDGDLYLNNDIFLVDGSLEVNGDIYLASRVHNIVILNGDLKLQHFHPQCPIGNDRSDVFIFIRHGDLISEISCFKQNFHLDISTNTD